MLKAAVFNDTTPTYHHGCNAVMRTLVDGLSQEGIACEAFWPVAVDWRPWSDRIVRRDIDLVVVNGEGSIHHSAERDRARFLCALGPFARDRLGVPAVLVNASLDALEPDAIEDLRAFDAVWVRESGSRRYCEEHGIDAEVVADLSFGADDVPARAREGLLVTDSVLKPVSEDLRAFAAATGATFASMQSRPPRLTRLLRKARRRLGLDPMARRLSRTADFETFLSGLAGREAVVTGRFHTATMCILTRTPFLAVGSNTGKIQAVVEDVFAAQERMTTREALASGAARRRVEGGIAFSPDEARRIETYLAYHAKTRRGMFERIGAIARREAPTRDAVRSVAGAQAPAPGS